MESEIHVWTALIGFDREASDKGAGEFLSRMGKVRPTAISLFLFHPDIVLQHDGLARERVLPPDNCSYYASEKNDERERQPWTNHELWMLVEELHKHGVQAYLAIMGVELDNRFHKEWISDHPELRYTYVKNGRYGYNFIKKFSDGRRFDEFFVGKLCRTLEDYGFDGVQTADSFCPAGQVLHADFCSEVFELFLSHANLECPPEMAVRKGDDREEATGLRRKWIRENHLPEWIKFNARNWTEFWKKLCSGVHAQGKKVINLGMYCTDPFETLYCLGIDQKGLVAAGVDYLMPNIVPTGLMMESPKHKRLFHRYMALAMLSEAYSPEGKFVSLLGVRDATEEWDVLHHAPCLLERDIYTLLGFMRDTGHGVKRSLDGLMMCLGDGIRGEEWRWLGERLEAAETTVSGVEKILSPKVVWSDAAFRNTLEAYHKTCRWTLHKWVYEMAERGSMSMACVRIEDVPRVEGSLFIPNFDLLPAEEQEILAGYKHGPVVATASAKEFDPASRGITPDFRLEDPFSKYPMCVFAWNTAGTDFSKLAEPAARDDGTPDPEVAELQSKMPFESVLTDTLTFRKVSDGFAGVCAALLQRIGSQEIQCSLPCSVFRRKDGSLRVFILNPDLNSYGRASVTARHPVKNVSIVTKYPVLPVKYLNNPDGSTGFMAQNSDGTQRSFRVKVSPGGVTIVDVML